MEDLYISFIQAFGERSVVASFAERKPQNNVQRYGRVAGSSLSSGLRDERCRRECSKFLGTNGTKAHDKKAGPL